QRAALFTDWDRQCGVRLDDRQDVVSGMRWFSTDRTVRHKYGVGATERRCRRDLCGKTSLRRRNKPAGRADQPDPGHEEWIDLAFQYLADIQRDEVALRGSKCP